MDRDHSAELLKTMRDIYNMLAAMKDELRKMNSIALIEKE